MIKTRFLMLGAAALCLASPINAKAEGQAISQDAASAFIESNVTSWLNDPVIVDGIKAQNEKHKSLSPDDVVALDKKWRADDQELISATTENALSNFLKAKLEESDGQFTEIFIMDDKGLNVGQSGLTSDYWQGDEAKWQESFAKGANAIHVSDVEFDESSQTYQVQISTTISDGETPIGAITLGIDAETIE
tara:strand:+ start:4892 stop:5467 length:576 start_codon:yes stop_codon:yes gene_type:complete